MKKNIISLIRKSVEEMRKKGANRKQEENCTVRPIAEKYKSTISKRVLTIQNKIKKEECTHRTTQKGIAVAKTQQNNIKEKSCKIPLFTPHIPKPNSKFTQKKKSGSHQKLKTKSHREKAMKNSYEGKLQHQNYISDSQNRSTANYPKVHGYHQVKSCTSITHVKSFHPL